MEADRVIRELVKADVIEESGRITCDRKNFYRRKLTSEEMSSFENAVSKYITYIRSLDNDSESVLFGYSEWRD